jgi:bifunctional non-homologous end joining protein LigD
VAQLREYRRKRDPARTQEPIPPESSDSAQSSKSGQSPSGNSFVIQEHHATALHWDFRLERDGVLVSWAIPKGLPPDPKVNHLAVQTEDHPLEYADFSGGIPAGQYGGGQVSIWDRGSYQLEKWTDREVKVVLSGERVQGRFVLIHTGGKQWLIHRMDGPVRADWQPLPDAFEPMLATPAQRLPSRSSYWGFEMAWAGQRALLWIEGGRIRLRAADQSDLTAGHPQLRAIGAGVGTTQLLLDGELVRFGGDARATFLIYDLVHIDGDSLLARPYRERRARLDALELSGPYWQTPPVFVGDAAAARQASADQGLPGVVAKKLSSAYAPGTRSPDWVLVTTG